MNFRKSSLDTDPVIQIIPIWTMRFFCPLCHLFSICRTAAMQQYTNYQIRLWFCVVRERYDFGIDSSVDENGSVSYFSYYVQRYNPKNGINEKQIYAYNNNSLTTNQLFDIIIIFLNIITLWLTFLQAIFWHLNYFDTIPATNSL